MEQVAPQLMPLGEELMLPPVVRPGGLPLDQIFTLFPNLKERLNSQGTKLSGGEQQMLAIGRAMLARPKLMMLDEPSLGLSPLLVERLFQLIADLRREGLAILLVEQNARAALETASYGYVLETGSIVLHGTTQMLAHDPKVAASYLGGREATP